MLACACCADPILPMKLFFDLPPGRRLAAVIALLLLLLGLSTALSLTRIRQLDQQVDLFELNTLPSVRLLHDMSASVEDLRGMAALHLVLSGTAELPALESQMLGQRQRMELRLATCALRLKTETDHRHHAAVRASVTRFWEVQDRLMVLSRRAAADPAAATAARLLLTGPAQQAFLQLDADLAAWWNDVEKQAELAAGQARSDAASTVALLLALAAAGLLAAGAALWPRLRPAAALPGPDAGRVSATAPVRVSVHAPDSPASPADRARVAIGRARAEPAPLQWQPAGHAGSAGRRQTLDETAEPLAGAEQAADAAHPPSR